MALAQKLRELRQGKGLSLDELAAEAGVSKTYLWELERDESKKPSAAVLMRIADVLSVTLAELLDRAVVQVAEGPVELPRALREFKDRMERVGTPLSDRDLRDLAAVRFRGNQPDTADEWNQLYLVLRRGQE